MKTMRKTLFAAGAGLLAATAAVLSFGPSASAAGEIAASVDASALPPVGRAERSDAEWRKVLTPEQFHVLREEGTERPGSSDLNAVKSPGVFACAACDNPVFDAGTKFESGTGWPSFYAPLATPDGQGVRVVEKEDSSMGTTRTEIECGRCRGHLGHVFDDGPKPTGLRYCMNGVAMTFAPTAAEPTTRPAVE